MKHTQFLARALALTLVLMLALLSTASAENRRLEIEAAGLVINYDEALEAKGFTFMGGGLGAEGIFLILGCIDPEVAGPLYDEYDAAQDSGNMAAVEAVATKFNAYFNNIATIMTMSKEAYETLKANDSMPFDATSMTDLGEHNGNLYWVAFDSMEVGDKAVLQSDKAIADWQEVAAELGDLSNVLEYIPVVKPEAISEGEMFPTFATKDMKGNDVTNDIFAGKDLTIVNFWATTCGPCISEMPELGEWARELPENVQIIGVLTDVKCDDAKKIAKVNKITDKAKVDFVNLTVDDALLEYCSMRVSGTPTTILVNSRGEIVGDAIVGAYIEKYKAAVDAYLSGK